MTPKTTAQRQQELRQRRAQQGLIEVRGIFAHPDDHAAIKEFARGRAELRRELTPSLPR